ncbi:MAG: bifunctional (p)ppGpp synthetase/guanosine-3',5'-bis(diphosphate) 3'-pyrophosphohydrolase [Deltaproteobacteria bacterium]|nr:bifunctional (p)ppGpp synthetase/guanosine-3',5'-bis(diphosphate) 3'-pyrophosphohydrolase [Deltaproteobacteria bacterium]
MVRLQDIIDEMRAHNPGVDVDEVKKAYVYSAKVHQGQLRKSGEPYLVHPLSVAHVIARLNLDEPSVLAALLHDTLEDTLATAEEIEELFGSTVRFLVEGVTKLSKINFSTKEERQAENVRKMLVAMSQDLRVILVKLADRLHNMRTLEFVEPDLRQSVSQETLDIFAPLANRLGIQWIRSELEDLSFKWLHPEQFGDIEQRLEQVRQERRHFIDLVVEFLETTSEENEIDVTVSGRIKHPYSIYRKMLQKNVHFDQIYDIIAFRIITKNVGDCYRMLGLIHATWKPVSGRFKDYIAMPKINRYQSLHTTVLGPEGERVEIQIRTADMHRIAEQGVAAHWAYKEGVRGEIRASKDMSQFAWLRELLDQQKELKDPAEFLESVKVDLFSDEVFVFTPQGEVKAMPRGATSLDFAYAVHTEVGHHCVGARVNGKIAPLRQRLKNGDTIEILTNKKQRPSKDWLAFVKTSRAKNKIRNVIRAEQRKRSQEIGREVLEKECKRQGVNLNKAWRSGQVGQVADELGFRNPDELMVALGYGKISTTRAIELLLPEEKRRELEQAKENLKPSKIGQFFKRPSRKTKSGILVQGLEDVMVRFGKCCNPIPGDNLVGVITRGRGVTVHTRSCKRVLDSDPERLIEVNWDLEHDVVRTISVRVLCEDRSGMLANITNVMSDQGINISQVNARVDDAGRAVCNFKLGIGSLEQFKDVAKKVEKIKGVLGIERLQN